MAFLPTVHDEGQAKWRSLTSLVYCGTYGPTDEQ